MENLEASLHRLSALVDRLRPGDPEQIDVAEQNLRTEIARLQQQPDELALLANDLLALLSLPFQNAFYSETGVRSALGFWLELGQRLSQRFLPRPAEPQHLGDLLEIIFRRDDDHLWVSGVSDELWQELAASLLQASPGDIPAAILNVLEAARVTSYRLAGVALDRELLRAEESLERYESPFLAQNAALLPILERARGGGHAPDPDEIREIDVLLDQCTAALERVRRKASEGGVSVRLTYLLARLRQHVVRVRALLDLAGAEAPLPHAVRLFKTLLTGLQTRTQLGSFIGENVSLLARNVTDHSSRHGEHYIAENAADWWGMARSAAGGGIIIALMAMSKLRLTELDLPPLTEGVVFGLNYGLGFVLIHLLGFTVATKQPAMTAAAIASTLQDARPRELERLGDFAQNVIRTQWIAVLGNIGLALPVAFLVALLWPWLTGGPLLPAEQVPHLLEEIHPLHSGALFFAALAGVGLFLSGLVSGYFDNQARYHQLAGRVSILPWIRCFGSDRAAALGAYLDTHYGAILGNLFFGMYLGLMGTLGGLTGLPVDIRHVAFASANVGAAISLQEWSVLAGMLPWAIAGVIAIALVNLAVSFSLALYVAMKSRRLGAAQIWRLGVLLGQRFVRRPFSFFSPPRQETP